MSPHITSLLFVLVILPSVMSAVRSKSDTDSYLQERQRILKVEKTLFIGGKINLTPKEDEVNNITLHEKFAELALGYTNINEFLPSQHFFQSRVRIEKSKVFNIIKKLPKAAALHTHMLAGVSVDYIIQNITYQENIYGKFVNDVFKLKFFKDPEDSWKSLQQYRQEQDNFDQWLRTQLSLEVDNPDDVYKTPESVWQPFKNVFTTQYDMVCYKPVFKEYIFQLLKELYEDNVMYTELRGTFMPLYDLDGTVYDHKNFFDIFIEAVNEFKEKFPKFLGVRYIHSIYRGVTTEVLKKGLDELIELKNLYPTFIAGFDFVGYEEEGHSLVDFHTILLEARRSLNFYFHAGETNWFGHTDLNLVDAVLLNSSRIGHGFTLDKHPVLIDMVKEREMAVEICPISNQVLKLNSDPRNHPLVSLMAKGVPVVISNDDPSVWGAKGLSYDWYITFMAMTSKDAGLEVLKQFAMNSIIFSAMEEGEKLTALQKWKEDWEQFLEDILRS